MTAILASIGAIFTAALGWMGDVAAMVTQATVPGTFDNPILLLFIVIPLVGLGVGLFRRILNVG